MKINAVILSVLIMIVTPGQVFSQDVQKLEPASKIRLTLMPFNQVTGKYSGYADDSIKVYSEPLDRVIVIPASSITNVEVFKKDSGLLRAGNGLLKGFGIGAVAGGVLAALTTEDEMIGGPLVGFIIGAFLGGTTGGAIGLIVGGATESGEWQAVPVEIIRKQRFFQSRKTTLFRFSIPLRR